MPTKFHIFGDSHAHYFFFDRNWNARRFGLQAKEIELSGKAIGAASVAGFRPQKTKLSTKEIIQKSLPDVEHLVLAFGQVDIELGYYYRKAIKGDTSITPENFIPWLVEIYMAFIDSLDLNPGKTALKGCNLTVLNTRIFTRIYVSRIVGKKALKSEEGAALLSKLDEILLNEDQQNAMSIAFNNSLKEETSRRGLQYFDINAETAKPAPAGLPMRLDDIHSPAAIDHHLVDSLAVRRIHYQKMLGAFDLPSEKYFAS